MSFSSSDEEEFSDRKKSSKSCYQLGNHNILHVKIAETKQYACISVMASLHIGLTGIEGNYSAQFFTLVKLQ